MSKYEKFDADDQSAPTLTPSEHSNVDLSASMRSNSSRQASIVPVDVESSSNSDEIEEVDKNGSKGLAKKSGEYEGFPEYKGSPSELTFREKLRFFLEHIIFRLFSLFVIIVDCTLLIIDLASSNMSLHEKQVYDYMALIFVSYFCVELIARIYAQGLAPFFSFWYNTLDFVIIVISFLLTMTSIAIGVDRLVKLVVFGRLIRVVVLIRLVRVVYTEPRNLQKAARHVVSENKRRLRDGEFDLDMTYITKNVIGMSFPSSGKMALYRNNIKDVAKYMDTIHGPGHYKVYNLCSERSYDGSYFHDSVASYTIDDHNVPTLQQMLDFVEDVKEFLNRDEKNVIAVHCKGGKGRTGTMICAWLIYNGQFADSKDVLDYFGEQRTDLAIGSKYQGVETPSQGRYVNYFNQVINDFDKVIPPKKRLSLKQIKITSLIPIGKGDGSDLTCTITIDREETFIMDFGTSSNCEADYHPEQDVLTVTPRNCPPLIGDVRLKFNCKTRAVPRAYEDCAFYFWFNTSFVDKDGKLKVTREDLDNPHKSKTWKIYREKFSIELSLEEVETQ